VDGPQEDLELLFGRFGPTYQNTFWNHFLRPRLTFGTSISTGGGTDEFYGGLTWDVFLTRTLFIEAFAGGALHDGDDDDFGCRDEPLGDAPSEWPIAGKVLWHEIANMAPAGVLTKADRLILEVTCRLVIEMREKRFSGAIAAQLRCCLASLGMTPADRSRVASNVVSMTVEETRAARFFTD